MKEFRWKIEVQSGLNSWGNKVIEVKFYFKEKKIFHNNLELLGTILELEKMLEIYSKNFNYKGYPFVCECGDAECSGIFMILKKDNFQILSSWGDFSFFLSFSQISNLWHTFKKELEIYR